MFLPKIFYFILYNIIYFVPCIHIHKLWQHYNLKVQWPSKWLPQGRILLFLFPSTLLPLSFHLQVQQLFFPFLPLLPTRNWPGILDVTAPTLEFSLHHPTIIHGFLRLMRAPQFLPVFWGIPLTQSTPWFFGLIWLWPTWSLHISWCVDCVGAGGGNKYI